MARGDVVIANSRYTADLIAQRYGTPRSRIARDPSRRRRRAFDPARIAPERVAALRARWGIDARAARHPAGGAAHGLEGPERAHRCRRAAARPPASSAGAVVVLAGDAQGRDAYVQTLHGRDRRRPASSAHVRLVGHVEDMPAAYLAAHVTVVASTEPEAFGRRGHRGGRHGLPGHRHRHRRAAGDRAGRSRRLPEGATTGWLVPPGDPEALARATGGGAGAGAGRAGRHGQPRARPHVLAHFTVEAMQRSTLAVYDRLLGTAPGTAFQRNPR